VKIHRDIAQGSLEWGQLRAGKVTASEMHRLVTPLGKIRTGDGPTSFLMEKVAESWIGAPLPTAEFWDADQGRFLEEYARPAFTLETGLEVSEVGFIESDDGRVGCSPDGLIGDDCGLEIKAPHLETHIKYLLEGVVPPDYVLQVQGSLYVTGFPKWKFFSFRRGLPPLILTVTPDPDIQAAIDSAVGAFCFRLTTALARLTQLNGGSRPQPIRLAPKEDLVFISQIPS
jgi:YqaJ-like recombinase protein